MKRILLFLSVAFLAASCSKQVADADSYGDVSLNIAQGAGIFVESTKADGDVDLNVYTSDSEGSAVSSLTGLYSTLSGKTFTLSVGNGYSIYAENCTSTEAKSANSNFGQQRFYNSSTFNVVAGAATNVTFECPMVNSKVSICYDDTFTSQFKSGYSVEVSNESGRTVTFGSDATLDSPVAFFDPNDNTTLNIKVIAVRSADDANKTMTATTTIEAKSWYKLTIKASSSSSAAGVEITVDETVTTVSRDVTVNPYEGE